ncbi:hypothetical protein BMR1_02g00926 [Babesia microti strain RI]|uniref:Uncharacterized protein n=1 Tax=Babesia microti (strain RI) TaxID=1133968 RepID=A0A1R4AA37_BABMR|nr:hypothetical protein BMR1_02g00926 [Babesia microti strain RI]SJK85850.1 hypothetical protein BMR1_02g00926 [Babesia microti strain RI]|eukprot:XP_021338064.1 hypothetical protein BMR1_02g00926 [Babesia microti strain RI]
MNTNILFRINSRLLIFRLLDCRFTSSLARSTKGKEYEERLRPFAFNIPLPSLYDRVHLFVAKCLTYGWIWVGVSLLCLGSMGSIKMYARHDEKKRYCL